MIGRGAVRVHTGNFWSDVKLFPRVLWIWVKYRDVL